MKDKKYIVTVRGVLKFTSGDKVESGGFVPSDISESEIKEKLDRGLIALFDEELSAKVQADNKDGIDVLKNLEKQIKKLSSENDALKAENETLQKKVGELYKELKAGAKEKKDGVKK